MRSGLLALVAVGLLAAPAASAADGDPIERHTAADTARARSVVLRGGDLRGAWTSVRVSAPDQRLRCNGFRIDETGLVETGEADSPVFSREGVAVTSSASLYGTARMAATSWNRAIRPGLPGCLAQDGARSLSRPDFRLRVVSARKVPYARVAPSTAAYRIVYAATDGRPGTAPVPFVADYVFLRDGRTLAAVTTISLLRAFPAAELKRLVTIVSRRMR